MNRDSLKKQREALAERLPAFQAPRGEHGRKEARRHLRAADFDAKHPNWTPTELYRRNEAIKKNLGLEGVAWNTAEYREAECWCECGRMKAPAQGKCARCMGAETGRPAEEFALKPEDIQTWARKE